MMGYSDGSYESHTCVYQVTLHPPTTVVVVVVVVVAVVVVIVLPCHCSECSLTWWAYILGASEVYGMLRWVI